MVYNKTNDPLLVSASTVSSRLVSDFIVGAEHADRNGSLELYCKEVMEQDDNYPVIAAKLIVETIQNIIAGHCGRDALMELTALFSHRPDTQNIIMEGSPIWH